MEKMKRRLTCNHVSAIIEDVEGDERLMQPFPESTFCAGGAVPSVSCKRSGIVRLCHWSGTLGKEGRVARVAQMNFFVLGRPAHSQYAFLPAKERPARSDGRIGFPL